MTYDKVHGTRYDEQNESRSNHYDDAIGITSSYKDPRFMYIHSVNSFSENYSINFNLRNIPWRYDELNDL